MTNKRLTLEEYYAIMTAGGRLRGERSRALPQRSYKNPADYVEFEAEIARQKKAKKKKGRKK